MELKHYYRITFNNQLEYFIEANTDMDEIFLNQLDNAKQGKWFSLQIDDRFPIHFQQNQVFSVQKISANGFFNGQTKIWRLV